MELTFKQKIFKFGKWFILIFILMFSFRFAYGFFSTDTTFIQDSSSSFFSSVENLRKNYASENKSYKGNNQAQNFNTSQKYEKTALVKSKSSQFEEDEKNIKNISKEFEGVIQFEQSRGNKGTREIHLIIGINPEKFENFYLKIQNIGQIKSTEMIKIDKTNEFKQLNAKKISLEKTLNSLKELKTKNGVISDYITLIKQILEIESKLQELGVELGNFNSENEFCTIKFSMYEGITEKKISFLSRIKVSLEWTIKYYAILIFIFFICISSIFVLIIIIEKLKLLNNILQKLNE